MLCRIAPAVVRPRAGSHDAVAPAQRRLPGNLLDLYGRIKPSQSLRVAAIPMTSGMVRRAFPATESESLGKFRIADKPGPGVTGVVRVHGTRVEVKVAPELTTWLTWGKQAVGTAVGMPARSEPANIRPNRRRPRA